MIPKAEDINIGENIEVVEEPSHTWKIEGNRILGYIDGLEAMKQSIYLILNIERYKYLIYDWNYGIELSDLFGRDKSYVYIELQRRIKEALLTDDRIISVENFEIKSEKKNEIHISFKVDTILGEIEISKEVDI